MNAVCRIPIKKIVKLSAVGEALFLQYWPDIFTDFQYMYFENIVPIWLSDVRSQLFMSSGKKSNVQEQSFNIIKWFTRYFVSYYLCVFLQKLGVYVVCVVAWL